jgi:dUTP pyrophosphatase
MYTFYIKFDDNLPDDIRNNYLNINNTGEDSGLDLYCPEDVKVSTLGTIDHRIKCCMVNNTTKEVSAYYLYPRSSICKYPLMLANHIGIIDKGYRGNIMAKVRYLLFADIESQGFFDIKKGHRLFQICSPDLTPFSIKIVDTLPDSIRGEGGFGSTGSM